MIHDFVGLHEAVPSLEDAPENTPQDQQSYHLLLIASQLQIP